MIRLFIRNPIAVNMLMVFLLGGGFLASRLIPREAYGEYEPTAIRISMPCLGMTARDVQGEVAVRVERLLLGVEGVRGVFTSSRAGAIDVLVTPIAGATPLKVADEIRSALRTADLPEGLGAPKVSVSSPQHPVILVALVRPEASRPLAPLARQVRKELLALRRTSDIRMFGAEAEASADAGSYGPRSQEPVRGRLNGARAILLGVYASERQPSLRIAAAVRKYVQDKRSELPADVRLRTLCDVTGVLEERQDMIARDALMGLVLFFLVMWLFISFRLSFWTLVGVIVALAGGLLFLGVSGMALNDVTLFALMLSMPVLMNHSIVMGEHIYARLERGAWPEEAAFEGARHLFASLGLVTLSACLILAPLSALPGTVGQFLQPLPLTVFACLAVSFLQCLLILPPHLAHSLPRRRIRFSRVSGRPSSVMELVREVFSEMRRAVDQSVLDIAHGLVMRLASLATRIRYPVAALHLGLLGLVLGATAGGHVSFTPFPRAESNALQASIVLGYGTSLSRTEEVAQQISYAAQRLNFQYESPGGEDPVQNIFTLIGQDTDPEGLRGDNIAQVIVELLPGDRRGEQIRTPRLLSLWRRYTPAIPEAAILSYEDYRRGPAGRGLSFRILADSTHSAVAVSRSLVSRLDAYGGLSNIVSDAPPGPPELRLSPRPAAQAWGLDAEAILQQIPHHLGGRAPGSKRPELGDLAEGLENDSRTGLDITTIDAVRIRTEKGVVLPLNELASYTMKRGYARLNRIDGKGVVVVSADVDEELGNADRIVADLRRQDFLRKIAQNVAGATVERSGLFSNRTELTGYATVMVMSALLATYALLAMLLRSYTQPLILLALLPCAGTGVLLGHWITGYSVTLLSLFAFIAVGLIVLNDSLALLNTANEKAHSGESVADAGALAARARFRPTALSALAVTAAFAPFLFERSGHAHFLEPLAIAVVFGVLFGVGVTLFLTPCLYRIGSDLRRLWHWRITGDWLEPEEFVRKRPNR